MTVRETPDERTRVPDPELRPRAEERLRHGPPADDPKTLESASALLHELRVHQIELEMQNEELRLVQEELEASRARYVDLYDGAAAGYLTLDQDGCIIEANLPAAALLGVGRGSLTGRPLSDFIVREDQDVHYLHRRRLLKAGGRDACELRLRRPVGAELWVRLEEAATPSERGDAPNFRVALSDITAQKEAELALRKSEDTPRRGRAGRAERQRASRRRDGRELLVQGDVRPVRCRPERPSPGARRPARPPGARGRPPTGP